MQKTDISKPCNATLSAFGHEHEENEDEDSDVHEYSTDDFPYSKYSKGPEDTNSEKDETCSEDTEESEGDGDEHEDPWITTDEDEDGHQDLDIYEADSEDQDTDTDRDGDDHQSCHPSEDQNETSNSKPDKETFEESPLDKGNLHEGLLPYHKSPN